MKKMKVISNFIEDPKVSSAIKNLLLSYNFPYYYNAGTANKEDDADYLFVHVLYDKDGQPHTNYFNQICMPILGRLNFNYLHRVKVNCYTKNQWSTRKTATKVNKLITGMHIDSSEKHQVALYSVNTNNGYTLFENGDKVASVENQLVLFDGSLKHCSVAQTDENIRVNININIT